MALIRKYDNGLKLLGKVKYSELDNDVIANMDKHYIHEQSTAAKVWTVTHNLNKLPSVQCYSTTDELLYGDIEYTNNYELKIKFKNNRNGIAICN